MLTNAVKHFKWEPLGKRRIHLGTLHPSAVLRFQDPSEREAAFAGLVADLEQVRRWLDARPSE
jgi:uracil-DNA glycosylase